MDNWNDRITQAKIVLMDPKNSTLRFYDVLLKMLDELKDPEPLPQLIVHNCTAHFCGDDRLKPDQPFVRNPGGKTWLMNDMPGNLTGPHLEMASCHEAACRPMTPAEAFRKGAVVERKYDNGDIYRGHIVGLIESPSMSYERAEVRCGEDSYKSRYPSFSSLTLVKPTPEERR